MKIEKFDKCPNCKKPLYNTNIAFEIDKFYSDRPDYLDIKIICFDCGMKWVKLVILTDFMEVKNGDN